MSGAIMQVLPLHAFMECTGRILLSPFIFQKSFSSIAWAMGQFVTWWLHSVEVGVRLTVVGNCITHFLFCCLFRCRE